MRLKTDRSKHNMFPRVGQVGESEPRGTPKLKWYFKGTSLQFTQNLWYFYISENQGSKK